MTTLSKRVCLATTVTLLLSGTYCYVRYCQEQALLYRKAEEIVEDAGARTRREQVVALRDFVRRNVRYEGVSQEGRPFLRDTAWQTLCLGKGYCGEATRTLVNLLAQRGIRSERVNLYGKVINHVVAEVEIEPGESVLVDPQDNPKTNPYLDAADRKLDEVVGCTGSMFTDYSNVNLRRMPLVSNFVQRIRLRESRITWSLENPWLLLAWVFWLFGGLLPVAIGFDRLLLRVYALRLGIPVGPTASKLSANLVDKVDMNGQLNGFDRHQFPEASERSSGAMVLLRLIVAIAISLFPSRLKILIYRKFYGYQIGEGVRIGLSPLVGVQRCRIGDFARIGSFNLFYRVAELNVGDKAQIQILNVFRGGELVCIGRYGTILRQNVFNAIINGDFTAPVQSVLELGIGAVVTSGHWLDFSAGIRIGNHTIIGGRNSSLWTHNRQRGRAINVGPHCYIGSEVRVAPGANLPAYCIVALGSVISGSYGEARSLLAGNPATMVRSLRDDDLFLILRKTRNDIPDELAFADLPADLATAAQNCVASKEP